MAVVYLLASGNSSCAVHIDTAQELVDDMPDKIAGVVDRGRERPLVLLTVPPDEAERLAISAETGCEVEIRIVKYSLRELESFAERALQVGRHIEPGRFHATQVDEANNAVLALSDRQPYPADLREAILDVVPADAMRFQGGVERQDPLAG